MAELVEQVALGKADDVKGEQEQRELTPCDIAVSLGCYCVVEFRMR